MNRRHAISNMVILSVGAVVLPSCGQRDEPALLKLKNISLTGSEEQAMIQLADTILPLKNVKNAADIKPYEFIMHMVDDCYEPASQQQFTAGLKAFEKLATGKYNKSFTALTAAQKLDLLTELEKKKDVPADLLYFYDTTKRHTIQAFTSSAGYMTNVMKYRMVPGSNFKGCVPVR